MSDLQKAVQEKTQELNQLKQDNQQRDEQMLQMDQKIHDLETNLMVRFASGSKNK